MGEVATFEPRAPARYPARCPFCGGHGDAHLQVGHPIRGGTMALLENWRVCRRHQAKWPLGSECVRAVSQELLALWRRNEYRLADFMEVRPLRNPWG